MELQMRDDDPFDNWLFALKWKASGKGKFHGEQARACLDRLAVLLDNAKFQKPNLYEAGLSEFNAPKMDPRDACRAQELYHRVVEVGGTGSKGVQQALLEMIACAFASDSVPFWAGLLDLKRPRDSFAPRRRASALAGLALLALERNDTEAWKALGKAARHIDGEVRNLAAYYIGRVSEESKNSMPSEIGIELSDVARDDTDLNTRFQARMALLAAGMPAEAEYPGGAYLFRISLAGNRSFSRTIALKSEQTLDDLHLAIQHAIDWDADHLYSFFMNGKPDDQRFEIACPIEEERKPYLAHEAIIGTLGLLQKHKFLYLFDFGDYNQFEVEVVDILPKRGRGRYPRLVESVGEAPEQYPEWDEEE
jgi:hypothetical protein